MNRTRADRSKRTRVLPGMWLLFVAAILAACSRTPFELSVATLTEELSEEFKALHARVYDVYQLQGDRDGLHDLLASSFAGDALTDEYVEHFTTLERMRQQETAIQVVNVDYEAVVVQPTAEGFDVLADWSVGGVVTHQQHRHPRVNRYQALFGLANQAPLESEPVWRIVSTRLHALERVASLQAGSPFEQLPTSARGTFSLGDLMKAGVVEPEDKENDAPGAPNR